MDPLALAPAAFLAGILMFLAPCTLPLVPGYLAFIAGVPEKDISKATFSEARVRVMRNAVFFVVGFSLVFIVLGLFAGSIGFVLGPWRPYISRAAGIIIIIFGLTMLGFVRIHALLAERRLRMPKALVVGRPESSFLIGALFALGWTPCIGPILGTVLLFASTSSTAGQGALLLALFSLGLGIPFLLTAFVIGTAGKVFMRMQGALDVVSKIAGAGLVLFGVCMLAGSMDFITVWATHLFSALGYDSLLNYL